MKKFILLICLFAFAGCTQTNRLNRISSEFNEQQAGFINFMLDLSEEYRNRPNDLDLDRFDKKMITCLDSIQPILCWKGEVSDIRIENTHELIYRINFKFDKFDCTFVSSFIYENEVELKKSHIYNRLLHIPDGSTVYFDGYINGALEETFEWVLDVESTDPLKYRQPLYNITVFEIYTTRPESLSPLVREQLSLYIQEYNLFWKKAWDLITDTEYNKELAALSKIDYKSFTEEEKVYLDRSREYLMPTYSSKRLLFMEQ